MLAAIRGLQQAFQAVGLHLPRLQLRGLGHPLEPHELAAHHRHGVATHRGDSAHLVLMAVVGHEAQLLQVAVHQELVEVRAVAHVTQILAEPGTCNTFSERKKDMQGPWQCRPLEPLHPPRLRQKQLPNPSSDHLLPPFERQGGPEEGRLVVGLPLAQHVPRRQPPLARGHVPMLHPTDALRGPEARHVARSPEALRPKHLPQEVGLETQWMM